MLTLLKFCPWCRKFFPDFETAICPNCSSKFKLPERLEKLWGLHPKKKYVDENGQHVDPKSVTLRKKISKRSVCSILTEHHEKLSDDNDHLQTDFILNLIRRKQL
jgi:hypothetical protein